ncbi:MAG: efflux RND transporter periplasmic adaptor subunit [Gemmataceae bacterium]
MSKVQRTANAMLTLAAAAAVGAFAWHLVTQRSGPVESQKLPKPAIVSKVVKEDELNTVTLTEEAEQRVGLTVAAVRKKAVQRTRVFGGEVTIPVGRTIVVSAPFAGVVQAAPGNEVHAGRSVKAGQVLFHLLPLLTPDGRATLSASLADAEGQVSNAKTQAELTQIALSRAKRVLADGAGSQRQVDEAQAAYDVAAKTLQAAVARQAILKQAVGDAKTGTAAPISVEAPTGGVLRVVAAVPGQSVPAGAPLFETVDLANVWVRVPLPVGDLDSLDRSQAAQVGKLAGTPETGMRSARPIPAPPSGNAISATIDAFYELPNTDGKLVPGQRLGVAIPLAEPRESLTVPWSAVVFDVHGGTWLYEQVAPHRFARKRAVVTCTVGADAVLASGPQAGALVVTAGAQQLFGAETGFVK